MWTVFLYIGYTELLIVLYKYTINENKSLISKEILRGLYISSAFYKYR